MEDTTYLTIEELKEQTAIVKSVDPSYLEPMIFTAEEMHIVPVLGTALDTELKDELESGTLTDLNETLVQNYIQPASAWYTFYESAPFLSIKAFNKGLVKQFSDNSNALDAEELKNYRQSIKDKAAFWRNRLIDYLDDNQDSYPNYRSDDCSGNANKDYASGIFLG